MISRYRASWLMTQKSQNSFCRPCATATISSAAFRRRLPSWNRWSGREDLSTSSR